MKLQDYKPYLSPALAKTTDIIVAKAEGPYLYDIDGKRYLDFVQGIAVNALGHGHPRVVAAMKEQIDQCIDASYNLVSYPTTLEYAKRIAEIAPGELSVTFFSNGGSEAIDGAIKLARAATGRPLIIAFRGSFHGRSLGATSVTASASKYRKHYEPLVGGIYFAPYPTPYRWGPRDLSVDPETASEEALLEIKKLFDFIAYPEDVAAFLIEPIMGEGGYVVPPSSFLKGLRKLADEHGILLIFDEIQSGYGRSGKYFASEIHGVVPDIMTIGKAMAGGLPMSGIVSKPEVMEKWLPGMHGTTFGGHPVAAAAGLAVLDVFEEEGILGNVKKQGEYLRGRLSELQKQYPVIGDVRGVGLMNAVEFVHPEDHSPNGEAFSKVRAYSEGHGLLLLGCGVYGNGLRFATPLNVSKEVLDEGLAIFEAALAAL